MVAQRHKFTYNPQQAQADDSKDDCRDKTLARQRGEHQHGYQKKRKEIGKDLTSQNRQQLVAAFHEGFWLECQRDKNKADQRPADLCKRGKKPRSEERRVGKERKKQGTR